MDELYKRPLGEILLAREILTEDQLEVALEEQKQTHTRLGEVIVAMGMATEEQITECRAMQLGVSYVNLEGWEPDPELAHMLSETLGRTYRVIPVRRENEKLIVAMVNPLDVEAIDLLQVEAKCHIEPALGTEWRINEAIEREYGVAQGEGFDEGEFEGFVVTDDMDEDSEEDIEAMERQSRYAPIIRMVNTLLTEAVRRKSSDIHIEPRRNTIDIRYRIDGELRLVRNLPKSMHAALTSRVKIMAELDIAERRLPQDGRITVRMDGRNVDLRVSTNPTLHGERVVLRVLDRSRGLIPLDALGFSERDTDLFKWLVSHPYGIILVTGPTGSGKTTTLYAALNVLKSEQTNIMTVEDPIEYELSGINQTNVHNKIGLTFANQLRTILRQDPDIVLVGEIRDGDTADIAFRAALTGHMVMSTLHCNDAPSAITRLVDMGVEPFLVSSAVLGVQAQRLVRCLCKSCKEPYEPDARTRMLLGLQPNEDVTLYRAVGCSECEGSGYKSRTSIIEIMVVNEEIGRLALSRAPSSELRAAAMEAGMISMRQNAANKVLEGITTVEEVQRKVFFDTDLSGTDIYSSIASQAKAA